MNLYEDLPLASDGTTGTSLKSTWTGDIITSLPQKISETLQQTVTISQDIIGGISQVDEKKTTKQLIPANLLFKPRKKLTPSNFTTSVTKKLVSSTTITTSLLEVHEKNLNDENDVDEGITDKLSNFEASDEYDPSKPNDFFKFCDERKERRRLEELQQENFEYLRRIEKERDERELEKKMAIESGDLEKLQDLTSGRGRGRGNISNLPSWMVS